MTVYWDKHLIDSGTGTRLTSLRRCLNSRSFCFPRPFCFLIDISREVPPYSALFVSIVYYFIFDYLSNLKAKLVGNLEKIQGGRVREGL